MYRRTIYKRKLKASRTASYIYLTSVNNFYYLIIKHNICMTSSWTPLHPLQSFIVYCKCIRALVYNTILCRLVSRQSLQLKWFMSFHLCIKLWINYSLKQYQPICFFWNRVRFDVDIYGGERPTTRWHSMRYRKKHAWYQTMISQSDSHTVREYAWMNAWFSHIDAAWCKKVLS